MNAQRERERSEEEIQKVRNQLDYALITADVWPSDAVDRLVAEENINVTDDHDVTNAAAAVRRYKTKHPEQVLRFPVRTSDKLAPYALYTAHYKEVIKERQRRESRHRDYRRYTPKER